MPKTLESSLTDVIAKRDLSVDDYNYGVSKVCGISIYAACHTDVRGAA